MKKGIVLSALLFLLVLCTVSMAAPADVSPLAGTYEGWYYANQGQTGLTLTVNEDGTGVFEFYNMPGRSNAEDGSYTIKATLENGNYVNKGDEWIEKPSTYVFVTLKGTLNKDVYTGLVDGNKNWEFVLNKNNSSYQEVVDSVYQNHSYKVFDESMTWQQAKEKCESLGGHLVTITSQGEQNFVSKLLTNGSKK